MLSRKFRQSNCDWDPAEVLGEHMLVHMDPSYWEEVERDLQEHPEIWARPDPTEMFA
jgi:hypothetical protein